MVQVCDAYSVGGLPSTFGTSPFSSAHGSWWVPQIWISGFSHVASSRVPALMNSRSGNNPASLKIGDPQLPQNLRYIYWPLSVVSSYDFNSAPVTAKLSLGTANTTEKLILLVSGNAYSDKSQSERAHYRSCNGPHHKDSHLLPVPLFYSPNKVYTSHPIFPPLGCG